MLDRPLVLSASALARTIAAENLGELHITLAPTRGWRPRAEEHAADTAARAEIARHGGIDRRGRLDADLAATFRLLCSPHIEYYGWLNEGDRTIGVLVAAIGRDTILAIRDGDTVHLAQAQPDRLPELLVAQAPDIPPGRGHTLTVALADLAPAPSARLSVGVRPRSGPPEVQQALRLAELPTTGGGELYAAVRDSSGRRHSSPNPVRYADTVQGRWLNVTLPGSEPRVVIAPADRRALVSRLTDLHGALTRR
ncbi:hypothetical protein [Alloactinosynnema sp. L-07]|uniref:ESX secretion-associated protein EspG n=1 Tax=Alloactinosynnema sp. L-07 TaxID=1653480 RepID=UPI00065EFF8A|nr:ESX secretion-associated protein EspG [Alloactinosynnema sp. L-07]CRK61188.1 hypothetical protein [Alloactinosynnema sp. L-07]